MPNEIPETFTTGVLHDLLIQIHSERSIYIRVEDKLYTFESLNDRVGGNVEFVTGKETK